MAYNKTNWVDRVTPVNAENMNKIENQLEILTNNMDTETGTTEINELKQNVQTLTNTTNNNTRKIATNENNITTLTGRTDSLETTTQGHTTKITNLEGKTNYLKTDGTKYEFLNGQGQYGTNLLEVIAISATSGTITLTDNKVHRGTFNGDITFTLPSITEHNTFHQILIQTNITTDINVTWNANLSFGLKSPTLTTGKYNLIFEHNGTEWIYGILEVN